MEKVLEGIQRGVSATVVRPVVKSDLGARLEANARERHVLIDDALVALLQNVAGQPGYLGHLLSTEIVRELETQGVRLSHADVADGLARLVRVGRVSVASGFYSVSEGGTRA